MNLLQLVERSRAPIPWDEGDNIPWNEPGFSQRMLQEHLSQTHDAASRRSAIIDNQVDWIHRQVLRSRRSQILDLGCGPGLYTSRFAKLGHTVRGIDFGPASIAYAQEHFDGEYVLSDVREADYRSDNDLVMMIYGEINVFRRSDAVHILTKAKDSLAEGGRVLLEPQVPESLRAEGHQPRIWKSYQSGLFSDRPHILLEESFWSEQHLAATMRYWVVDAETAAVTRFAQSKQHYFAGDYRKLLDDAGLRVDFTAPSLDGSATTGAFSVIVASRK